MADYLPEPQFSYTKQLEAYDALIEKESVNRSGEIYGITLLRLAIQTM